MNVQTENYRAINEGLAPSTKRAALTVADIKVGRVYQGKRPRGSGFPALMNDRQVRWISFFNDEVQYDSPTVAQGRNYPKVSMEKFLAWAGEDVTEKMPKGQWRPA